MASRDGCSPVTTSPATNRLTDLSPLVDCQRSAPARVGRESSQTGNAVASRGSRPRRTPRKGVTVRAGGPCGGSRAPRRARAPRRPPRAPPRAASGPRQRPPSRARTPWDVQLELPHHAADGEGTAPRAWAGGKFEIGARAILGPHASERNTSCRAGSDRLAHPRSGATGSRGGGGTAASAHGPGLDAPRRPRVRVPGRRACPDHADDDASPPRHSRGRRRGSDPSRHASS